MDIDLDAVSFTVINELFAVSVRRKTRQSQTILNITFLA